MDIHNKPSSSLKKPFALVAEFSSPKELLKAAKTLKEANYKMFDAHSPFPIHGMDKAMGLGDSKLGWIVAIGAFLGFAGAFALQIWAMTTAYPFVISGKPLNSLEAFVPIAFELTILFSAFSATFGMIGLNNLPKWHHPLFSHKRFHLASSHKFFISVQVEDECYNRQATSTLLSELGGTHLEEVSD